MGWKEKIRWWNLEPVATVPRYDSSPLCDSAWCRPCGARPLIDQSQALASGWVGDAVMLLLPPFNKASKPPLLLTALIRTTVWARLVPSRLTGFGCDCQSTRVDPCPSTTPGPEPGREGYTQALSQHPQSPSGGGALCLPSRLPTPRCEPRATVLTQQCFWSEGSVTLLENRW